VEKNIKLLLAFGILIPSIAFAHPGNTAADGCHYCRTNCDKWGVPWGERHCHRAKAVPQPSEPIRSHWDSNKGYTTPAPDYAIPKAESKKEKPKKAGFWNRIW